MFLKIPQDNALKKFLLRTGIRSRLAFMFAVIFGTTTFLFSIFLYYFFNQSLLRDFDDALYNYGIDISQTIEIGHNNNLTFPPVKIDEGKIFPFRSGDTFFIIRHISGEVLAHGSNAAHFDPAYKKHFANILSGKDSSYETISESGDSDDKEDYRLMTFPLDSETKPTLFLQIAAPMSTLKAQLDQIKLIMSLGLPGVLFVAVLAGLYLSSRALRPVQQMIDKTNHINAAKLDERVTVPPPNDEIKKLAQTINSMLARIETAFASQEKFIANASHQLLTPITILKGEIELELKKSAPPQQKVFTSLLQEIDALTAIVQGMLLLAKIDSGKNILQLEPAYISDEIIELLPSLKKIAAQKNITLKVDIVENHERKTCLIDTELTRQLFYNLIENAIKYSATNETVMIRIFWNPQGARVEIEDRGIGIAESAKREIFSRFSRADSSSKIKGNGLGLSIAQKIASLHGTQVILEEKSTVGALFSVQFPWIQDIEFRSEIKKN